MQVQFLKDGPRAIDQLCTCLNQAIGPLAFGRGDISGNRKNLSSLLQSKIGGNQGSAIFSRFNNPLLRPNHLISCFLPENYSDPVS